MDATNEVFLGPDDIIHNLIVGEAGPQHIEELTGLNTKIIRDLRKRRRPVLILVDVTKAGKPSGPIREAGLKALQSLDYDKLAVYGKGHILDHITNLVTRAHGHGHKVRYFDSLVRAIAFLEEKKIQ